MKTIAAVLFTFATMALALATAVITRIWDEQADSSDSAYVETSSLLLAIGLLFGAVGWLAWRRR